MTFGTSDQTTKEVLEAKVKGLIRSNISQWTASNTKALLSMY